MAAPKGNRFWEARTKHGRDLILGSPEKMWESCCEYFQWNEDNPLWEEKLFAYQGEVTRDTIYKMRAMTIEGLRMFLGIGEQTWYDYKAREGFSEVIARAEEVIRRQKFEGAAAELLNPNIIARDLGLRDKQDHAHTGPDGGPVEHRLTVEYVKPDSEG